MVFISSRIYLGSIDHITGVSKETLPLTNSYVGLIKAHQKELYAQFDTYTYSSHSINYLSKRLKKHKLVKANYKTPL